MNKKIMLLGAGALAVGAFVYFYYIKPSRAQSQDYYQSSGSGGGGNIILPPAPTVNNTTYDIRFPDIPQVDLSKLGGGSSGSGAGTSTNTSSGGSGAGSTNTSSGGSRSGYSYTNPPPSPIQTFISSIPQKVIGGYVGGIAAHTTAQGITPPPLSTAKDFIGPVKPAATTVSAPSPTWSAIGSLLGVLNPFR